MSKCRVRVISGDCTAPGEDELAILSAEELDSGIRLACCCKVKGKVILLLGSDEHRTRILENQDLLCRQFIESGCGNGLIVGSDAREGGGAQLQSKLF